MICVEADAHRVPKIPKIVLGIWPPVNDDLDENYNSPWHDGDMIESNRGPATWGNTIQYKIPFLAPLSPDITAASLFHASGSLVLSRKAYQTIVQPPFKRKVGLPKTAHHG